MGYYFSNLEITPFKAKGLCLKEEEFGLDRTMTVYYFDKFEITPFKAKGLCQKEEEFDLIER